MSILIRIFTLATMTLMLLGCSPTELAGQATVERTPLATSEPPQVVSPTPQPPTLTPQPPTLTPQPPTLTPQPPTLTPQPAPAQTFTGEPVRLVIPAIKLDRPLVAVGLDQNRVPIVPNHDAAWYNLSARPGQGENIVLWGHVLRFRAHPDIAAPFARMKELEPGAHITLFNADGGEHQYTVIQQVWASPEQVEYILPQGRELVTMVSCIGDKVIVGSGVEMTHRLITIAAPIDL